ncbi:MAG: DnaJ domain-containing protein [Candidatus Berkelbacteria bacterium]
MANDYYKTLGVEKGATIEEIKKAYRKLALQYHPDRGGTESDHKKFNEVSEAYQVLSDPQKRSQYDQFGRTDFSAAGGQQGGFGGFQGGGFEGMEFDFGGFGDIFENFFGQAFSQVQAEIRITPAQAVLGDKLEATIGDEKINFDIPAGVQDGQSFRFPGKGKSHKGGRGDLILTVRIELPRHITKEQRELWEKLRESESKKHHWWN